MSHPPFLIIDVENVYQHAFDIKPPAGIELPEDFPNCCEGHKKRKKDIEEYLRRFPNCCEEHRKFAKKFGVTAKDFDYLKKKYLYQLAYTEFFIQENINKPDWYKKITNYIELNVWSFGLPGVGLSQYGHQLRYFIEKTEDIKDEPKRQKLLGYFDKSKKKDIKDVKRDLTLLYRTYGRWLKCFPFDLPYFQSLKIHFSKTLPFIEGETEYNPYTGLTSSKLVGQKTLVSSLVDTTKQLLSLINTKDWFQENKIDENSKLRIQLIAETHRVTQEALLGDFSKKESKYTNIIRSWLVNERDFFVKMKTEMQTKPELPAKPIAFNYKGDLECISDTLQALHNLGAISKEVKLPRFKKLFNGEPVSEPINWLADQGDLKTFIKTIQKCPQLECPYQQQWNIAVQCFTLHNNKLNAVNLKSCKETKKEIHFKRAAKNLR
jgi:spore coat protein CotF